MLRDRLPPLRAEGARVEHCRVLESQNYDIKVLRVVLFRNSKNLLFGDCSIPRVILYLGVSSVG